MKWIAALASTLVQLVFIAFIVYAMIDIGLSVNTQKESLAEVRREVEILREGQMILVEQFNALKTP